MAKQQILYEMGIGLFLCAAVIALGVIAAMIVPNWRRIARLLAGDVEAPPHGRAALGGVQ
jgi:hypothetical protein